MFNVYPQRATRPNDMDTELNKRLHQENMNAFEYILSLSESKPVIWAAWGKIIEMRSYLFDCLRDMIEIGNKYDAKWVCCGNISKKGHPHHPLYLPKNSLLKDFDAQKYTNQR